MARKRSVCEITVGGSPTGVTYTNQGRCCKVADIPGGGGGGALFMPYLLDRATDAGSGNVDVPCADSGGTPFVPEGVIGWSINAVDGNYNYGSDGMAKLNATARQIATGDIGGAYPVTYQFFGKLFHLADFNEGNVWDVVASFLAPTSVRFAFTRTGNGQFPFYGIVFIWGYPPAT